MAATTTRSLLIRNARIVDGSGSSSVDGDVAVLERGIHRLTGELADAFGIRGRGRIAPGLAADLVLFDPDTIDRGAEEFISDVPGGGNRYVRHAAGIEVVVVNGAVTWEQGQYTGARAGQIV